MKSLLKHPIRVIARLLWFGAVIVLACFRYLFTCAFRPADTAIRARWLQRLSRQTLRVLGVQMDVSGPVPERGLLVSNHLSYVDILAISACAPVVFVAKREVRRWPVFGWLAQLGGTVFVDRENRARVGRTTQEIDAALARGALVVLFPEGTSSDGKTILPFKSSLLEPATQHGHPLATSLIQYELPDGDVGEEVCYWKDMTLVPHLLNLLSKRGLRASLRFTQTRAGSSDRKQLARQLHSEIMQIKAALAA